jgi:hypothetical protein
MVTGADAVQYHPRLCMKLTGAVRHLASGGASAPQSMVYISMVAATFHGFMRCSRLKNTHDDTGSGYAHTPWCRALIRW